MIILVMVVAIVIFYLGFSIGRWTESIKLDNQIHEVEQQIKDLVACISEREEVIDRANEVLVSQVECVEKLVFEATSNGIELDDDMLYKLKKQCAEIRGVPVEDYLFTKQDAEEFFG